MEKKKTRRRGNGEGTIYYNSSLNKWVAQFTLRGKRKAIYGDTRAEVAEKMHKTLASITENTFIDKSSVTVSSILDLILEEQEKSNRITENTLARNKHTANVINNMYIANMPIQKVSAVDINKCLLDTVHYSNSYIEKIYMLLSTIFNKAMLLQIINMNPFLIKDNIIKPRSENPDKKVDAFTIEEHKAFLKQLEVKDYKYKDIFYILIETRNEGRRGSSIRTWRLRL